MSAAALRSVEVGTSKSDQPAEADLNTGDAAGEEEVTKGTSAADDRLDSELFLEKACQAKGEDQVGDGARRGDAVEQEPVAVGPAAAEAVPDGKQRLLGRQRLEGSHNRREETALGTVGVAGVEGGIEENAVALKPRIVETVEVEIGTEQDAGGAVDLGADDSSGESLGGLQ